MNPSIVLIILLSMMVSCQRANPQDAATEATNEHNDTAEVLVDSVQTAVGDSIYVIIGPSESGEYLFGYANREDTIIPPQFELVGEFYQGVAPVVKGETHGLINLKGEFLHEFTEYQFATWYNEPGGCDEFKGVSEGRYMVTKVVDEYTNSYAFIDNTNQLITTRFYEGLFPYSERFAQFYDGKNYGYINYEGKEVIPARYTWGGPFSENLAPVMIDSKYGFIDTLGNLVIKPRFTGTGNFSQGYCAVTTHEDGYGAYFYIDRTGKTVIQGPFEEAGEFVGDSAYVQKRGTCRLIDRTGKELKKLDWDCFARC